MSDTAAQIEQRLRTALSPQDLTIVDDSAAHSGHPGAQEGGGHFIVTITAEAFTGKSLLERHRMVYGVVEDMMRRDIHALSVKAHTPDETH